MTTKQRPFQQPPTRPGPEQIIVQQWRSVAATGARHIVLPDGCRDLILTRRPGKRPDWFISDLSDATCHVAVEPGQSYRGFRLRPGVRIDAAGLLASLRADLDDTSIAERLHRHVTTLPRVSEALQALNAGTGPDGNVAAVAARLGVQTRTLQRLLARETGRAPVFWMRLARVRRCAAEVGQAGSLAELAYDRGFADQAHMSREIRHWLGVTPREICREVGWAGQYLGPGYGA